MNGAGARREMGGSKGEEGERERQRDTKGLRGREGRVLKMNELWLGNKT